MVLRQDLFCISKKEKARVFGAIRQAPTYGFYYRKWLPVGLYLVTSVNFITWKLKLAFISDPKEHQSDTIANQTKRVTR